MKFPWLIQRCKLVEGKLKYEYMGSSEFEWGDQSKSLKRIFASGILTGSTTINVEGKQIIVHMLAGEGFIFAEYQQYLQQLAEHKLCLKERTNFDDMVKMQATGIKTDRHTSSPNVWFDFKNDVLWVLSKNDLKALISVLEGIKQTWAKK